MNTIKNRVPLLVFILTVFAAFAFNMPNNSPFQNEFGSPDGSEWYDVTSAQLGQDYLCVEDEEAQHCTYDQPSSTMSNPIGDIERRFVLLNEDLEPIEL